MPDDSLFLVVLFVGVWPPLEVLAPAGPGGGERDGDLDLDGGASFPGFHMISIGWGGGGGVDELKADGSGGGAVIFATVSSTGTMAAGTVVEYPTHSDGFVLRAAPS